MKESQLNRSTCSQVDEWRHPCGFATNGDTLEIRAPGEKRVSGANSIRMVNTVA